ncbi:ASC-1-like (ASCH) protein [Alkalihalobacillus xiaoxiensis]|uniref:ASC-1-like (ASCH) protein n=1 Tax=Shouchella xiaoxiensis TaxID=766895 RepID=A0ABS2SP84_9BACI|nr:ASCH domain-containing protein [Shouchella xiaoxiensis]MBM7836971.1 ASC-1-like (ASCH) protein [Shouchella xiaoxiensis]
MIHDLTIYSVPYRSILNKGKTVEVRLNDDLVNKIRLGDQIRFLLEDDEEESFLCSVTKLESYKSFSEMYLAIDFRLLDSEGWTLEEMLTATYKFYSLEEEMSFGALAIGIELVESMERTR